MAGIEGRAGLALQAFGSDGTSAGSDPRSIPPCPALLVPETICRVHGAHHALHDIEPPPANTAVVVPSLSDAGWTPSHAPAVTLPCAPTILVGALGRGTTRRPRFADGLARASLQGSISAVGRRSNGAPMRSVALADHLRVAPAFTYRVIHISGHRERCKQLKESNPDRRFLVRVQSIK